MDIPHVRGTELELRKTREAPPPSEIQSSRLSFAAAEPPDPRRVSEGLEKGVSEGFSQGFTGVLEGSSADPF